MTAPAHRMMGARALVAGLALCCATACGDGEPGRSTPETTEPTADAAGPVARIEVLGGPDWLAADDEWVYVKRDDGRLDRVDPTDGEVVDSVDVGGDLCQGLGAGEGSIWTCRGPELVRVDFDRGGVVATVAIVKAATQGTLAISGGRVWVLLRDGSALVGVDVDTGEVGPEVALGVRGTDLEARDGAVWVVSGPDDTVLRVDTATGAVVWRAEVAAVTLASGDDGTIWAGGRATTRLDADTGAVLGVIDAAGPGTDGSLTPAEQGVWVRSADDFLQRVDPDGTIVESFDAQITSGGDVLVAHGVVWATAYDDAALFRITR